MAGSSFASVAIQLPKVFLYLDATHNSKRNKSDEGNYHKY